MAAARPLRCIPGARNILRQVRQTLVGHAPGSCQDHPVRPVVFADKPLQVGPPVAHYQVLGADDRAPKRLVRVDHALQLLEHHLLGIVPVLVDFIQDDLAFHLDVFGCKLRVEDDVRQQLDRQFDIPGQHPDRVCRPVPAGIGIQVAPDILDRARDIRCRSPLCPLERHVLKKMGNAVLVFPFMPAASPHVKGNRHRLEIRHRVRGNREPVAEFRDHRVQ